MEIIVYAIESVIFCVIVGLIYLFLTRDVDEGPKISNNQGLFRDGVGDEDYDEYGNGDNTKKDLWE